MIIKYLYSQAEVVPDRWIRAAYIILAVLLLSKVIP